jgi:hypothetical protein
LQSKPGISGEKLNETSRKKGFPIAKGLHRNKSIEQRDFNALYALFTSIPFSLSSFGKRTVHGSHSNRNSFH